MKKERREKAEIDFAHSWTLKAVIDVWGYSWNKSLVTCIRYI